MIVFRQQDIFGNIIQLTAERWNHIQKHEISDVSDLKECLRRPYEVRESKYNSKVHIYYRKDGNRLTATVVHNQKHFIITAYKTKSMKKGDPVWKRD